MFNLKKISDEVFYTEGDIVTVARADLDFLKMQTQRNPRKRARLCTHTGVPDRLHEMLIINKRDTYVRPHKNTNKPKSFCVLEGVMDVVVFDDGGRICGATRLGAYGSGLPHYFRLHQTRYHTLRTVSDTVIFQETTIGPFQPGDTVFAPWSPEDADRAACKAFWKKLDAAVATFMSDKEPSQQPN